MRGPGRGESVEMTPIEIFEGAAAVAAAGGLAFGGYMYAAGWPASQIFGRTLVAPERAGEMALTFDDGPNPRWTPLLLDVLARYDVRATFFMMGKYAASQPELVRRVHEAGHLIGNHSWTHPNFALTGAGKTREELARTSAELEQITGAPVRYFRPPFGARRPATLRIARELGMTPVTWNIIGYDWDAKSAEAITAVVTKYVARNEKRGFATNLTLHDGGHRTLAADRSLTVEATGQILERYRDRMRFVRLDAWETSI